ncbi:MAG: hypothetical protein DI586_08035 [Micavibrio aeruginosavorus]|uniref:YD repeat-containing protein n=1 Tax=Micavibrio aeruginosavorus TaxID=349221 RepID=A0A2W5FJ99_9BACT|nr:MAG: hypothetical protein DI586_08035 [Micavibrio aeruginosavorus]
MTKAYTSLALALLATVSVSACTQSKIQSLPPGQYTTNTKTTQSDGTDTSVKKTTTVGYDANGNKVGTVKTDTTNDPEGLFNKSKTSTTQTVR